MSAYERVDRAVQAILAQASLELQAELLAGLVEAGGAVDVRVELPAVYVGNSPPGENTSAK